MTTVEHSVTKEREGASRIAARMSEIILGGQDGLVNTMGVILGVAAASQDQRIIVAAGLAATFAESISMAAVAYTSRLADLDYYRAQVRQERREIREMPEMERQEIEGIFQDWGFEGELLNKAVDRITQHEAAWIDIMMAHELEIQPVARRGLGKEALLVGISAIIGSMIPLLSFFVLPVGPAIAVSLVVSALALFAVGAFKAHVTVGSLGGSGLQMAVIGIISALAGYAIGALFGAPSG